MLSESSAVLAEGLMNATLSHLSELIAADQHEPSANSDGIRDQTELAALMLLMKMTYRRRGYRGVRHLQDALGSLPELAA